MRVRRHIDLARVVDLLVDFPTLYILHLPSSVLDGNSSVRTSGLLNIQSQ